MSGPLTGIRVIELAGVGPGPFAGMMLSDMGADVIRIDRSGPVQTVVSGPVATDTLARGRRSLVVDLKHPRGVEAVLQLVDRADALIEGYRPGVTERLGLGPEACHARNPRLVYGRMTGWGQTGPYASTAGHDINYVALSGTLAALGRAGQAPTPPANLVGDFGGGGMLLAFGVACGLLEARSSGEGQVIDAAMLDGSALLATLLHGLVAMGAWTEERGTNLLDTGAPFYDVYECADGGWISVGSLEPQFYAELIRLTGLELASELPPQMDPGSWPELRSRLEAVFRAKTRAEWCEVLEGTDACFAPVLGLTEAASHPHNIARGTFVEVAGVVQPAPAPRFSRTPGKVQRPPADLGEHSTEVLIDWGFDEALVEELLEQQAIR